MSLAQPPAAALKEILGAQTRVYREVNIYEEDGETPFLLNAQIRDGSVTVDQGRDERRMCEFTLGNPGGEIKHSEQGLWYDKIVKPYRGCYYDEDGETKVWKVPCGEFFIMDLESASFPYTIRLRGTDYTSQMTDNNFGITTTFVKGTQIDDIIKAIALNAGIKKINIPNIDNVLTKDQPFEKGTSRWSAIFDLAQANGYEIFFDASGYLTMRPFLDPTTSPVVFNYKSGEDGVVIRWNKQTNQTRVYNQVFVYGDTDDATALPVFGSAINMNPLSPTSVPRLGRTKTTEITSVLVEDNAQATELAETMLPIVSLEEYNLSFESLVLPWLEVGEIVNFDPSDWQDEDPTRFLLSSFTIPFTLGTMSPTAKRVVMV